MRVRRLTPLKASLLALLLVLVVILVVAAAIGGSGGGGRSGSTPVASAPTGTAREDANAACQSLLSLESSIAADASKTVVFHELDQAQADVTRAENLSREWLSLASGVESLQEALTSDNGAAATVGIAIVRDQCRLAGVFMIPPTTAPSPNS